MGRFGQYF